MPVFSDPPASSRRHFLSCAVAAAFASLGPTVAFARSSRLGEATPFSFTLLQTEAQALSRRPYQPPPSLPNDVVSRIDYDAHGKIRFDPKRAVFAEGPGAYPVTFFHPGRFFPHPVRMFELDTDGAQARERLYDRDDFSMPADSPARELPEGGGFAGFRIQESRIANSPEWERNDWVAFLGAAYFRAIGGSYQYGLSARGVAINPGVDGLPEEFPAFTRFYFQPAPDNAPRLTIYALLDGPSITGAYRFDLERNTGVDMTVECALFLREDVQRLGVAPLTSMYWFSEKAKPSVADWRPEVHDSDGLALWTATGEHIWRPLNNPPRAQISSFQDNNPRGFGLLQRDRNFDHYLDGVHYERRPSLWVAPEGEWGPGVVQLIELPTDDEIHDNIVAMWVSERPARAGDRLDYRYRLFWQDDEPFPTPLARCMSSRLGNGGQPGQPRPPDQRKFTIEFVGGPLADLPFGVHPEAVIWASRGEVSNVMTEAIPNDQPGHWRAQFDLKAVGEEPVELRLFLRRDDQTLSETWAYQYHPMQWR